MDKLFSLSYRNNLCELDKAIATHSDTVVFSCAENAKYQLIASLNRPFLYIAGDLLEARRAVRLIKEYSGKEIVYMPEREDPLRADGSVSVEIKSERAKALYSLVSKKTLGVVCTPEGALQYFPDKNKFLSACHKFCVDGEYDVTAITANLVEAGYARVDGVDKAGSFSVHGDRLEVWSMGAQAPYRVEFFGDQVETIKEFAPDTRLSVREIKECVILPASDILVSQNAKLSTLNTLANRLRTAQQKQASLINKVMDKLTLGEAIGYFFAPFFTSEMCCLTDYLDNPIVVFSDVKGVDDKLKTFCTNYAARVKNYAEASECFAEHKHSMQTKDGLYSKIEGCVKLGFNLITSSCPAFRPQAVFSIKGLSLPKYYINREALLYDLKNWSFSGATVVISCQNRPSARAFQQSLLADDLKIEIAKEGVPGQITIVADNVSQGFVFPEEKLVLIGYEDIFRRSKTFSKPSNRKKEFKEMPKEGDYIVHDRFGIGISEGVKSVKTPYGNKDYFVVLYKAGDRLYVPPDQMDEIEKWTGSGTPALHRIGGNEFEKIKERVKAAAKEMAIDLLALYEKRERAKGFSYSEDSEFQKELEDSFPYEETSDQIEAIKDIKEDMESGKIMDRLLAGDVGYGKTEVALRAMFKTIWDGKQAALLCPTTILAEQHYNTIAARLNPFGIKPVILSRLQKDAEIKAGIKKIASGDAQIIIATHRLLSSDIAFHDLGLLVLDEEQRFGVEHKEKIKALKTNVNVLTMTATPIPRTLHMALSGIRDISLLTEAPKNRLPVETYVTEYTDALAVDVIKREVARDGQVYILFNDTKKILAFYKRLQALLPDVNMVYAHGQMSAADMDDKIRMFYNKDARVLIATTIIENGIDIPDANTLIVLDADKLGLSSLYQLRGRVGRSDVAAYAYFTIPEERVLSGDAAKRLSAILECGELGSGFRLAERDLEIRGAGNVLGKEQHGNMEKVGYDMYLRLIKEAVDELRGVEKSESKEVEIITEAELSIPTDYIKNDSERIALMSKCARLADAEQRDALIKEITEVYGRPPQGVLSLADIGECKNLAQKLGLKTVSIGKRTYLTCYDLGSIEKGRLLEALGENVETVTLSVAKEPMVNFRIDRLNIREKIHFVRDFLEKAVI